ncbi:Calx-beta domain-containing protein [Microbacterium hominis]|uniref:Calx-beta domain-containing protein n=1 Tax=Microbacterium hominis TaxID=162426 RepID=A0A7D4UAL0_9MICO|nr:Calx-beta domain-containing protein [Microbacterium hominis]QKJ18603.1 hypothetical protein HQM25_03860 [Microbacterium hominis]
MTLTAILIAAILAGATPPAVAQATPATRTAPAAQAEAPASVAAPASTAALAAVTAASAGVENHDQWMKELEAVAPTALKVPLWRFIFPGSHDAGTYDLTETLACENCGKESFRSAWDGCRAAVSDVLCGAAFSTFAALSRPWAQAQDLIVYDQLMAGSRFLDLRFFRATADDEEATRQLAPQHQMTEGTFYIHHTLRGPTLDEILLNIVTFLEEPGHERELLILRLDKLYEGAGDMPTESLSALFAAIEAELGPYLAPASLGVNATPQEVLDSGAQVILALPEIDTSSTPAAYQPVLWSIQNGSAGGANEYPTPDNHTLPWRTDWELVDTMGQIFEKRADPEALFSVGATMGLDGDGTAIIRQILCPGDPGSVLPGGPDGQLCPAIIDDWDEFGGLDDVSAFTNPRLLPALTQIRRDLVNIVHVDYYSTEFTEEVFLLNKGATRTAISIATVKELSSHDDFNGPDYYPVYYYGNLPPSPWQIRSREGLKSNDSASIIPYWSAWRAYPNDWGTASMWFGMVDADVGSDDDWSAIDGSSTLKATEIDVSGCFADVRACPAPGTLSTSGTGSSGSSTVQYSLYACVWSWLPNEQGQSSVPQPDELSRCDRGSGPPNVTIDDVTAVEGTGATPTAFDFTVRMDQPRSRDTSIRFQLVDGTATTGALQPCDPIRCDYGPASTARPYVRIPAGAFSTTVRVNVSADARVESEETFEVRIFDGWPADQGLNIEDGTAIGTIIDDDVYAVSIADASLREGTFQPLGNGLLCTDNPTPMRFDVTLSEPRSVPVRVAYTTRAHGGTALPGEDYTAPALAGQDYTPTSGTLEFSPGVTTQTLEVTVKCDRDYEPNETFEVALSIEGETDVVLGRGSAVGTILDDDDANTIQLTVDGPWTEGSGSAIDPGATFSFTVAMRDRVAHRIVVAYETVDGSAEAPGDYTPTSGTVTIEPLAATSERIEVKVIGDTDVEPDEEFFIQITGFTTPDDPAAAAGFALDRDMTKRAATIRNDDFRTLNVTGASVVEGTDCVTTPLDFTVELSGESTSPVTVRYDTVSGTATANTDYTPASGLLTFEPGETTKTVRVDVLCDSVGEADEELTLALTTPTGATLAGGGSATGEILTDDVIIPPPTVTPHVEGTLGENGWYVSDVVVSFTVETAGAPVTATSGCDGGTVTGDAVALTFTCTVTTGGGTATGATTVKRDANAPTATATLSGTMGENGWYVGDVTVNWTVADTVSGLASTCEPETSSAEGPVLAFECTVSDNAGNETSATSPFYQADSTDPTVTYTGNAGEYGWLDTIAITCVAADSGSGVADHTCADISGPAYDFPVGTTNVSATATDEAGNMGAGSTSFTVRGSLGDLCALVRQWVTQPGVANSLCVKLAASDRAFARGEVTAGNNTLAAFIAEVDAQTEKEIADDKADILISLARQSMREVTPQLPAM